MQPIEDERAGTEQSPYRCPDCLGTGKRRVEVPEHIERRTDRWGILYRRVAATFFMKRCWSCQGNGLDPGAFFRWSVAKPDTVVRVLPETSR